MFCWHIIHCGRIPLYKFPKAPFHNSLSPVHLQVTCTQICHNTFSCSLHNVCMQTVHIARFSTGLCLSVWLHVYHILFFAKGYSQQGRWIGHLNHHWTRKCFWFSSICQIICVFVWPLHFTYQSNKKPSQNKQSWQHYRASCAVMFLYTCRWRFLDVPFPAPWVSSTLNKITPVMALCHGNTQTGLFWTRWLRFSF